MSRDYRLYLEDIIESSERIQKYTKGMTYEKFASDNLVGDAVVRNLEIIGEAAKNIPPEIKKKHSEIEWRKVAGVRDIIAHEYFGVNTMIIWDIVKNKVPEVNKSIKKILRGAKR